MVFPSLNNKCFVPDDTDNIWCFAAGVPVENILYLGGPNIAAEIYNREYANARICGAAKWRRPLAMFLRQPHFIVWDNGDLVTHEVMGGLKNVYAIGAGKIQLLNGAWTIRNKIYVFIRSHNC